MQRKISSVTVLMSTYNGEKYIREQLDSILAQKHINLTLVIRDDCSTDGTVDIIKEYLSNYDNIIFEQGTFSLGACGSFFELMSKEYDTDYYALSDQDDIWDDDKLIRGINFLNTLEGDCPKLYYSNLRIVDKSDKFIRNSHDKPMISNGRFSCLTDVFVTGCTAIYNANLAEIVCRIKPKTFSMHDTWLYMVASLFGKTIYDFEPHIDYRQHDKNVVGTRRKRISIESFVREFHKYFNWKEQYRLECAREIMEQFKDEFDSETRNKIELFINYKKSVKNTWKVLRDKEIYSENRYRRLRAKICICLKNI